MTRQHAIISLGAQRLHLRCLVALVLVLAGFRGTAQDGTSQLQKAAKVDYLWLDSAPQGAAVEINGESRGTTPLFVKVKEGAHQVRFLHDGYETLSETLTVPGPNDGGLQVFTLRRVPNTLLLDSTPKGVSIIYGSQLLGRTPYLFKGLREGEHEFRFVEAGFDPVTRKINFGPGTDSLVVKMKPNTGAISVKAIPARAQVFVDGHYKGTTVAEQAKSARAKPLEIPGFKQGLHTVHIEFHGVRSDTKKVKIEAGRTAEMFLNVWYPDFRVQKRDGNALVGMLLEKNGFGDLVLAKSVTEHVRVLATQIDKLQKLSREESLAYIKKAEQ